MRGSIVSYLSSLLPWARRTTGTAKRLFHPGSPGSCAARYDAPMSEAGRVRVVLDRPHFRGGAASAHGANVAVEEEYVQPILVDAALGARLLHAAHGPAGGAFERRTNGKVEMIVRPDVGGAAVDDVD